jgi:hypothetical protein
VLRVAPSARGTPGYSSALLGVLQGTTGSDREGSSAVRSAAWSLLRSTREYSRVLQGTRVLPRTEHSLRWTEGLALPHSQGCAAAAPHLDETQKVDGRGVEVLRRDVRDERLPGSVALDRRELHTSAFGQKAEMWRGEAQFRCRCGGGSPVPVAAHVDFGPEGGGRWNQSRRLGTV